jgi:hypothetical protein
MALIESRRTERTDLKAPARNRYFYGKLLDVYHFELETEYLNAHRHRLNRLVAGYGVVAGLNVGAGPDERQIVVHPGFAIDKWGREIVVPEATRPLAIPPEVASEAAEHRTADDPAGVVRVMLCYHQCESDPVPVLAGDCGTVDECEAGTLRERYRVVFKPGPAPPVHLGCRVPDVIFDNKIDYEALTKWVSGGVPELAVDPCIALANVRLTPEGGHACDPDRIDITVRPLVYSNDLLFEIILALLARESDDGSDQRRPK